MTDSLDDFFAKKDKSKGKKKAKSKYTANDLLTQEETKKIKKKKDEPTPAADGEPAGDQPKNKEEEEWSEYVEEKETDYSGLRIQSIQIRDEDPDSAEKDKPPIGEGDEEDGEDRIDGPTGPWANVPQPPAPPEQAEAPPPPKEEPAPPPPLKTGKYVPPSMRNQSASSDSSSSRPSYLRRKKEAPNLQSEEDFPTLGGGPPEDSAGAWGSGARFEKVRSGGRQMDDQTSRGPRLELGNKYDALRGGADSRD